MNHDHTLLFHILRNFNCVMLHNPCTYILNVYKYLIWYILLVILQTSILILSSHLYTAFPRALSSGRPHQNPACIFFTPYMPYGHVQRMEEGRIPKEVLKWRPSRRRKRGRPKLTWAEGIRGMMGEKGLMEED
jgi:hypothetical protein